MEWKREALYSDVLSRPIVRETEMVGVTGLVEK
jgi:hypothetical protein